MCLDAPDWVFGFNHESNLLLPTIACASQLEMQDSVYLMNWSIESVFMTSPRTIEVGEESALMLQWPNPLPNIIY